MRVQGEPTQHGKPHTVGEREAQLDAREGQAHMHQAKLFVPHNHGFRPRERPLYSVDIPQAVGDSFCVFFFVYTATGVKLA